MENMPRKDARILLKKSGFKLLDFADHLGIKGDSLTTRWRNGLDQQNQLMLHGFLALNDDLYQQLNRHRDNEALLSLLKLLESQTKEGDLPETK